MVRHIIIYVLLSLCGFIPGGRNNLVGLDVKHTSVRIAWNSDGSLGIHRSKGFIEGIMSFESALKKTLNIEGGLSLDPDDSGNWTGGKKGVGELRGTKYGISAAQYPNEDIPNLSPERARFLYKRDYWDALRLGEVLHEELQEKLFDCAVNMGVETAGIILQNSVNFLRTENDSIDVDGRVGPQTIQAVNQWTVKSDWAILITFRCMRFQRYYEIIRANPVKRKYRLSWLSRI
jgi:lysozyme family protein